MFAGACAGRAGSIKANSLEWAELKRAGRMLAEKEYFLQQRPDPMPDLSNY
jgi:hypothetical protein